MIKIALGNIFDHKCDLLVIPCSSVGSIATAVAMELESRNLPTDFASVPHGEIHFRKVRYENAGVLAYASSVNGETRKSELPELQNIAKRLSSYCRKNGIGLVNLPLLGTGAGRITPIASFQALSNELRDDEATTYVFYCYSKEVFEDLSAIIDADDSPEAEEHPRCFISYAGNDKANAVWVKELASALRENGVDARLDQFHLKPGFDLPQWMTNEVIMAEKVLLICDSHYMGKADFRKGGVGWETMVIQGDMLAQGDGRTKYIAIAREDRIDEAIPIYMRSKFAMHWGNRPASDEQLLKELLLLLFERDTEPPLGRVPAYVRSARKPSKRSEGTPGKSRSSKASHVLGAPHT